MALINCRNCGRPVSDRAERCPHCGAPVRVEQTQGSGQQTSPPPHNKNNDGNWFAAGLSVACIIGIIGIITVGCLGNGDNTKTAVSESPATTQQTQPEEPEDVDTTYDEYDDYYYEEAEEEEPEEEVVNDRGYLNGYEWVDLGLSVMWATCNVGASSPYDCGGYYAWGETFGKNSYDERNSRTFGADMGSIAGNPSYDAARANWGASWRLPTEAEARELTQKCEWTSTSMNGVKGYEVKGPNGNSIFLPAAGGFGEPSQIYNISPRGCYYWTGTPFGVDPRKATCFGRGMDYTGRGCGLTVRAVAD